jgi:hypothetical protein
MLMKRNLDGIGTFKYGVGTISAGETHVDITHNLGTIPLHVSITPADGLEAPYQVLEASITDSLFTVGFVGGITLDVDAKFLWSALK